MRSSAKPTPDSPELRRTVQQVQVAFPQIYLACHTRHQRKRSTAHRLSSRDASILSHLDQHVPISQAVLAKHLNVAKSTLSEALKRLGKLGYVTYGGTATTGRLASVILTPRGATAISDTSVLETPLLLRALERASRKDLKTVAAGLNILAALCRQDERSTP